MKKRGRPPKGEERGTLGLYITLSMEGKAALMRLKRDSGVSYAKIIDELIKMKASLP